MWQPVPVRYRTQEKRILVGWVLQGGISIILYQLCLSLLIISIFSFTIWYIMISRASLCLSSRLCQFRRCKMSPTLDVFRSLLVTKLADRCWTISGWSISPLLYWSKGEQMMVKQTQKTSGWATRTLPKTGGSYSRSVPCAIN